jgi:hypothetical protein
MPLLAGEEERWELDLRTLLRETCECLLWFGILVLCSPYLTGGSGSLNWIRSLFVCLLFKEPDSLLFADSRSAAGAFLGCGLFVS